ncbi:Zn-dependent exopeptidase [Ramicandelaber brevisporus]|nr:Zn-dependent exopeptidase [Ramicandelaber brevisporus]
MSKMSTGETQPLLSRPATIVSTTNKPSNGSRFKRTLYSILAIASVTAYAAWSLHSANTTVSSSGHGHGHGHGHGLKSLVPSTPPAPKFANGTVLNGSSDLKDIVRSVPNAANLRESLDYYTSVPHLAGTENSKLQAEWTRDIFAKNGIDAEVVKYYPYLNRPGTRRVAIVSPPEQAFEASLREDVVDEDPTSHNPDAVPTFHGFAANGDVTAPIVYANYGTPEDFERLAAAGVTVRGTIALVKYGANFRGLKVRAAEQAGCVGVLIYSDPADDGFVRGKEYPEGPWRPKSGVQRGSVQYLSVMPGDPLTPGYAATKDAPRIPAEDATQLASIPSLPISWGDALPLLRVLNGHGVNATTMESIPDSFGDIVRTGWEGGLTGSDHGVEYFTGPSAAQINLVNQGKYDVHEIYNVIGRIDGWEEPDKVVVLGNHRDAWIYGAVDPNSGSAMLVELARTLGELLKTGWRPRRTIILGSWDAEEYGLIGSTEWVEDNAELLRSGAVAYVNIDTAVGGHIFSASTSPILSQVIEEVTKEVTDPDTGKTVYERWAEATSSHPQNKKLTGYIGAGSDYVAFLDFVGVPSIDMGFSGGEYGVYHSNYDSFNWMAKFGDPDFVYHRAMTQIAGLVLLRLADDAFLNLQPTDYGTALSEHTDSLQAAITKKLDAQRKLGQISTIEYAKHAATAIKDATTKRFGEECQHAQHHGDSKKCQHARARWNSNVAQLERRFIDEDGLPGRPWYKHVVYAPGLWAGYASQPLPSLTEAVDTGDWDLLAERIEEVVDVVKDASKHLHRLLKH